MKNRVKIIISKLLSLSLVLFFTLSLGEITACSNPSTAFPIVEGVNGSFATWNQGVSDDFDWAFSTAGTPSSGTGPSGPYEGSHYIYIEGSGNNPSKSADIISTCFTVQSSNIITFYYHMLGSGIGSLALDITTDDGSSWSNLWSESGDQGTMWQYAVVDLSSYTGQNVKLRLRATTGAASNGWQSDISLDDINISVSQEICDDGIDNDGNGLTDDEDPACRALCENDCPNSYRFNWYDGIGNGGIWDVTNGESTVSRAYEVAGPQGNYNVVVSLDNADGQNIDFANCGIGSFHTGTCNDPNASSNCDGTQFSYGCNYLTFGITADNNSQETTISYEFDYPALICDFEIGDIDYDGRDDSYGQSYQDEVVIKADSAGIPVAINAVIGSKVTAVNNNTIDLSVISDYALNVNGDLTPFDVDGHAYITTAKRVTKISFTYRNGSADDGVSNDQAIRLQGFDFCPIPREICEDGIDNDGDNLIDEYDPDCSCIAAGIPNLNFNQGPDGQPLAAGTLVAEVWADYGVHISTKDVPSSNYPAMIFDSRNPVGGDDDLGTPNETFGGPGKGNGGEAGRIGENNTELGNVLIVSASGAINNYFDGGTIVFNFDESVDIASLEIVDFDYGNTDGRIRSYDENDNLVGESVIYSFGDNSYQKINLSVTNVRRLEVASTNSFSIASLSFCDTDLPTGSIGDLVWHDVNSDGFSLGESGISNVSVSLYDNNNKLFAETLTDASGLYTFENLPAGQFRVDIVAPSGFNATSDLDSDNDNDSGVFTLATNENRTDVDFGLVQPPPTCVEDCPNPYRFDWFNGTDGAVWPITNGEAELTRTYTVSGDQGDYDVNVTISNPDGQNIDFTNCGTAGNHFYTATCNDPGAGVDCDGDPNTTDGQFSYGCDYLTFGITSDNSDQSVSITYEFPYASQVCNFEIGDIDYQGSGAGDLGSWQDEVHITADSLGVPVSIYATAGESVKVNNNDTPDLNVVSLFDDTSGGNLSPNDPKGQAFITTHQKVTRITFTYSNGPDDDGSSDDHAIRIQGFDFCPIVQEICGDGIDNDGDGSVDSDDPECFDCQDGILVNPGFEDGLAPWDNYNGAATVEVDVNGNNFVQVSGGSGGIGQYVDIAEGDSIFLSFYAKKSGIVSFQTGISFYDASLTLIGDEIVVEVDTDSYERYEVVALAPANVAYVKAFAFKDDVTGTAFLDGFCLEKDPCSSLMPGKISGDEDFCTPYDASPIIDVINPVSDISINYEWLRSTDSTNWTNIAGASGPSYDPGTINVTTYFRRVAYTLECTNALISNTITKKVDPTAIICLEDPEVEMECANAYSLSVTGQGIKGISNPAVRVLNAAFRDEYIAVATFSGGANSPDNVTFRNEDGVTFEVTKQYLDGESGVNGARYFEARFAPCDSIYLDYEGDTNLAEALNVYVANDTYYYGSYISKVHKTLSPGETHTVKFAIDDQINERKIYNNFAISGLEDDGSEVIIRISAGGISLSDTLTTFEDLNSLTNNFLNIEEVPSDTDSVYIDIISPVSNGQSVYLTGYISTVVQCDQYLVITVESDAPPCAKEGDTINYTYTAYNFADIEFNNVGASSTLTGSIDFGTDVFPAGSTFQTTVQYIITAADIANDVVIENRVSIAGFNFPELGIKPKGDQAILDIGVCEICGDGIDNDGDDLTDCDDPDCLLDMLSDTLLLCIDGNIQTKVDLPDGDVGGWEWSLTSQPAGANANINKNKGTIVNMSVPGVYIAELGVGICNNTVRVTVADCDNGVCYAISEDNLGSLYAWADDTNVLIGNLLSSGTSYFEAMTLSFDGQTMYSANGGRFGTVDIATGLFTQMTSSRTGTGVLGNVLLSDIDALAINPANGLMMAVHRVTDGDDLLYVINPLTGEVESNYFGPGLDYTVLEGALADIDDIAYHPTDGKLYGVSTISGSTNQDQIVEINQLTGLLTVVSTLPTCDIEGLTFDNNGNLFGSTGRDACLGDDRIYQIDYSTSTGSVSLVTTIPSEDVEALVCYVDAEEPCKNIESAGLIAQGQTLCSGEAAAPFTSLVNAAGSQPDAIEYQWYYNITNCDIPLNNEAAWIPIGGATASTYDPGIVTENTCYIRAAKYASCDVFIKYSNVLSIDIIESPSATTVSTDENCDDNNGNITFTFPNNPNQVNIGLSIDGGNTYEYVADNSGSYTFNNLAPGTYNLYLQWAANSCPVDIADETVGEEDIPVAVVTGSDEICVGAQTTLSPSTGGTWVSSDPSIATVTNQGVVTGVAIGTATFTYTQTSTNCVSAASKEVSVAENGTYAITGDDILCLTETTTFTIATTGGTWSSSDPAIISVNTQTGEVTANTVGTAIITYTQAANACGNDPTISVEVSNDIVLTYAGGTDICQGENTFLLPNTGGEWVSNDPSIANITNTGIVIGIRPGTVTFTFTDNLSGCSLETSDPVVVTAPPSAIIDYNGSLCLTDESLLSVIPSGGTAPYTYVWAGPEGFTDNVKDINLPQDGNYYVTVVDSKGCEASTSGFVYERFEPYILNVQSEVCEGDSVTLTAEASNIQGFQWSTNAGGATLPSTIVHPQLPSSSYAVTVTSNLGCTAIANASIDVLEAPVVSLTGADNICSGSQTQVSPTTGGTWISTNPDVATVNNLGVVNGVSQGTVSLYFTSDATGCPNLDPIDITVRPEPTIYFEEATQVCIGNTSKITADEAGVWTSSDASIASIDDNGNIVAISQGTVTFTFVSNSTGCIKDSEDPFIVHPNPEPQLPADKELCIGETLQITPADNGVWTSSNSNVATVNDQGFVTAIAAGTVRFTFVNLITGCSSGESDEVTVLEEIIPILTGDPNICVDAFTTLSPSLGGTWVSDNESVATINNNGIVTGVSPGTARFIYTRTSSGCVSSLSEAVTVEDGPIVGITGQFNICTDGASQLTPTAGGVWTSNNNSVATVDNSGYVTPVASGTATFTFVSNNTGCQSTTSPITVLNDPVVSISGPTEICISGTTQLQSNASGAWSVSDNTLATVSATGVVTGIAPGVVTFTFTEAGTNCPGSAEVSVTILPRPSVSIIGADNICVGSTTTLEPTTGGSWVSSNISVASVTNDGIVTGIAQGIARFTFYEDDGCISSPSDPIIVYGKPQILESGDTDLCEFESISILPASGGTWVSSNTAVATITDEGIITGVAVGTATFTFTDSSTGCVSDASSEYEVTQSPTVSLDGNNIVCIGGNTQMSPSTGGTWSSSDPAVATIDNNGLVLGLAVGDVTFTYTSFTSGCTSAPSATISVDSDLDVTYNGADNLCIGGTTALLPNTGGIWSSTNPSVATINNLGQVFALTQGTARFYFTSDATGCQSSNSTPLTVNGPPLVSTASADICVGEDGQLSPSSGGTWESSDTDIATVSNAGIVTAVVPGTVYFTYTNSATGCVSNGDLEMTVLTPTTVSITGDNEICIGGYSALSPNVGGVWISNNPAIATVSNNGVVKGKAPGKVSFTFIDSDTGCSSGSTTDLITVTTCLTHDFNVTTVGLPIASSIATNDNLPAGTTYENITVISKPESSIGDLNINSDGTYTFEASAPGKYLYKVQVCIQPVTQGCTNSLLEITVLDNVFGSANPLSNLETAIVYGNTTEGVTTSDIDVNTMSNDYCVKVGGCTLDNSLFTIVSQPSNGEATIESGGMINYIPNDDFVGFDTLTYEVCSSSASNCSQTMQIYTVNDGSAENSIFGADDFGWVMKGDELTGNVLGNDGDPEGDNISITAVGSESSPISILGGSYFINSSGEFTFTPDEEFTGYTEIVYTICDDQTDVACVSATQHILVFDDIRVAMKVYLEGSLLFNNNDLTSRFAPMMRNDLRVNPFDGNNYIPVQDPYTFSSSPFLDFTTQYTHVGPGLLPENQVITDSVGVFSVEGDNAIVDWVFVELRSKDDMLEVIGTRSALVQRDGDVVDLDGVSNIRFKGVNADSFYVAVKHRSHLGAITELMPSGGLIDFTDINTPIFDYGTTLRPGVDYSGLAMNTTIKQGYRALWAGDFNSDGLIKFTNPDDDLNWLFFEVLLAPGNENSNINYDFAYGYYNGDYDMDGRAKFTNPDDDTNLLFFQILLNPLNTQFFANFSFFDEQVPR